MGEIAGPHSGSPGSNAQINLNIDFFTLHMLRDRAFIELGSTLTVLG